MRKVKEEGPILIDGLPGRLQRLQREGFGKERIGAVVLLQAGNGAGTGAPQQAISVLAQITARLAER